MCLCHEGWRLGCRSGEGVVRLVVLFLVCGSSGTVLVFWFGFGDRFRVVVSVWEIDGRSDRRNW